MIVTQDGRHHVNPAHVTYLEVEQDEHNDELAQVVIRFTSGDVLYLAKQKDAAARQQAEVIAEQVDQATQRIEVVNS